MSFPIKPFTLLEPQNLTNDISEVEFVDERVMGPYNYESFGQVKVEPSLLQTTVHHCQGQSNLISIRKESYKPDNPKRIEHLVDGKSKLNFKGLESATFRRKDFPIKVILRHTYPFLQRFKGGNKMG